MTIGISGISSASTDQDTYPFGVAKSSQTQSSTSGAKTTSGDEATFSQAGVGLAKQSSADGTSGLTPAQEKQVDKLKETDRHVRAHEQAHMAAGGSLVTGGAVYQYRTGPDGKQYAVGGEVRIDTSEEKDPEATLRKAERIKSAALAPADPSGQDRAVAAGADAMAAKAQREIATEKAPSSSGGSGSTGGQETGNSQSQASQTGTTTSRVQSAYTNKQNQGSLIGNLVA